MRLGIAALAASIVVAGCSAGASQTKARIDATTLASGWRVDCRDDHAKAERTCSASTFGSGARGLSFFQIAYVNGAGPHLLVPHDFPGRTPTVRVDNGPVLSEAKAIVESLKSGSRAYVVFHVWPTGEDRMEVAATGFAEAYALLQTKL